ncbi:MAG: hypothetical protein M0P61_00420 [Ignavibacteriaceae bacterium]|nr:hypothetical protein [Ignavibacteriaceae bacterium]
MPLTLEGKTYTVPGVYGTVEIINLGSTALPVFNTLLIVAGAKKGVPYNATGKKGYEVILPFSSLNTVKEYYGVSDISRAFEYAKKGGAGVVYCINAASLTRANATILDNAGIPVNAFDVYPRDNFYGAAGNDISITMSTATSLLTLTIIPPKLTKFLTANASTSSPFITLGDVEGLAVGMAVKVYSNAITSAPDAVTIVSIDTVNNQVELSANPTAAFATSAWARLFVEDTDKQATTTFTATATVTDVINWINSGNILTADRKTYAGIKPTTLAKVYLQNITSATKGTSPAATETGGGDFDLLAGLAPQLFEELTNYTKQRIRLVNVVSSSSSVHAVYKTLAVTERAANKSIQLILGCATGDILLAADNAAHPKARAKVLNSDDCILAGMGMDGKASYLSFAPFVGGLISANSVKRNFTNDAVDAQSVEKTFGEFNKETDTAGYLANGVLLIGTGKNGYYIIQGINTYQNQATIWNTDDKKTYLIQQRQIVDYVYEGYKNEMELGVGADGYGPSVASVQGGRILKKYQDDGFISDWKIVNAYQEGNAVITEPQINPIDAVDFVGFKLKVIVDA